MSLKFIKYIIVMSVFFVPAAHGIGVRPVDPAASIENEPENESDPAHYTEELGEFQGDAVDADGIDIDSDYGYTDSITGEAKVLLVAKKRRRKRRKRKKSCRCSSGCGLIMTKMNPVIRQFAQKAIKKGMRPLSCRRPQYCQDRLRKCYNRCGQRGRAAKISRHRSGRACDFSRKHRKGLSRLKRGKFRKIKRLLHKKSHGGGIHESI